ncbi:cytochrome b [Benzoatithermus flavus]|uniref:Cytochrome b/b6 domain-containing protein n=1 Tax=Benzoatithermus flavus TaxID=3108223 RepID=A0ABU8XRA2_9PROT
MLVKDSRSGYGLVSIALHWSSAFLVAALVWLGWTFTELPRGPERDALAALHISLGFLALFLAAARLGWRLACGMPAAASSRPRVLEERLARIVHRLLLAVLLLLPLTGILTVAATGRTPMPFGLPVPIPLVPQSPLLHEVGETLHVVMANFLLLPLVGLHVLGALKHHLLDRDATLRRMLRPAAGPAGA